MSSVWRDIRYGVRMLRKTPGFTAIVLATLAIGIGANTIMFSMVNVLLLRPTQVKAPDQLVLCNVRNTYGAFPYSAYAEVRRDNPAFSEVMAYNVAFKFVTLTYAEVARRICPMFVSANYFSFLGITPAYGRTFLPEEERWGAEPVVVLSYRTWQRAGADPDVVGTYVAINGTPFRVIGVAPKGFTGTTVIGPELWLPLGSYGLVGHVGFDRPGKMPRELWEYPDLAPVGRLKPDLTISEAQTRLQYLAPRLKESHPIWWKNSSMLTLSRLPRLSTESSQDDRASLSGASLFLMSTSAVVLLIACVNLANMAIIRGAARHREIALRMALGGDRWRVARQLLVESLLLALLGCIFGLVLALGGIAALNTWLGALRLPVDVTGSLKTRLDIRVLAATLTFSLIAALLSGLKPALRLSRRELVADLKESRREVFRSTGRARPPASWSVVCQITLSVVLVMGAAMFARSAQWTSLAQSGVTPTGKMLIELDSLAAGYDLARAWRVHEDVADCLKSIPGVRAVSLSASFPFAPGGESGGSIREYLPGNEEAETNTTEALSTPMGRHTESTCVYTVGAGYFEAMGMPLLRGRTFNLLDGVAGTENVVIIDENLARRLRPDGNALGCLIEYGARSSVPSPRRVVGVVPNLRIVSAAPPSTQIYEPIGPKSRPAFIHLSVVDGARGTEAALLPHISRKIRAVDSHIPVITVSTLADWYHNNPFVWLWGFGARLAVLFGAMALFLASLGIYAVKGYMVASRTPEIGIRKALGATRGDILGMVLREGMVLTLAGLVVGLLLGLAVARLIRSLLYGISPVDPVSMVVTAALLGAASLFASYIPARRAAKVDPMVALKSE